MCPTIRNIDDREGAHPASSQNMTDNMLGMSDTEDVTAPSPSIPI